MAWVYILMHVNIIWEFRKRTSTVLHSLRKVRFQLIRGKDYQQMKRKENILTTTTTTTTTTLFRSAIACSAGWQCLLSVSFIDWILSFMIGQLKSVWTMWKISWIYHKLHYQLAIAYSAGWPMPCLPCASPILAWVSSSGPFLVLKCTKQIQLLTFDNQPILTLKSARVFKQLSLKQLSST